jgi:hypothetical protein
LVPADAAVLPPHRGTKENAAQTRVRAALSLPDGLTTEPQICRHCTLNDLSVKGNLPVHRVESIPIAAERHRLDQSSQHIVNMD